MSKLTAAYIAGFVDGEGYIGIVKDDRRNNSRRTDSYTTVIKIANTDRSIIDWLLSSYGGTFHKRTMKEGQKDAYYWTLAGEKIVPFLDKIAPYLKIKRKQADVVRQFRKTYTQSSYDHIRRQAKNGGTFTSKTTKDDVLSQRDSLYQKIRELNHRGNLCTLND